MKVLVTNGAYKHTLALVRALGAAGHSVGVVAHRWAAVSFFSKYCTRRHIVKTTDKQLFVDEILTILQKEQYDVLLPVGLPTVVWLAERAAEIRQLTHLPLADVAKIKLFENKQYTHDLSVKLNIPTPLTFFPKDRSDADICAAQLTLPIVVKHCTRSGADWLKYAYSVEEAVRYFEEMADLELRTSKQEKFELNAQNTEGGNSELKKQELINANVDNINLELKNQELINANVDNIDLEFKKQELSNAHVDNSDLELKNQELSNAHVDNIDLELKNQELSNAHVDNSDFEFKNQELSNAHVDNIELEFKNQELSNAHVDNNHLELKKSELININVDNSDSDLQNQELINVNVDNIDLELKNQKLNTQSTEGSNSELRIQHSALNNVLPLQPSNIKIKNIMFQEYLSGGGFGFFGLYDKGILKQGFAHQRIREFPISGGASCCAESIDNQQLISIGRRILEALEWHGVAMVEFKMDSNEQLRLLEVNPKLWGSFDLSVAAGVPFAEKWVQLAMGEPIEGHQTYQNNIQFSWLMNGDLRHGLKTGIFWKILRGGIFDKKTHTNLIGRDPLASLFLILSGLKP